MEKGLLYNSISLIVIALLTVLVSNCSSGTNQVMAAKYFGDSITTIDGITYYWRQFAVDSARIIAVKGDEITDTCLVTGPIYGAVSDEDGNFLIDCGEDQYFWFDTRIVPKMLNLMTEDDMEQYSIEDEHADMIINLE